MRKLDSYVKKYGKVDGPKMFARLQREAALASAHARHKKAIANKNPAAVELGAKGGTARAKNLSKEELSKIGRAGAAKRWSGKTKKGGKS
jgi:hypothetical protein